MDCQAKGLGCCGQETPHGPVSEAPVYSCMQLENKQEELEVCMQLQGYNLIGVTETWDSVQEWAGVLQWVGTGTLERTGWRSMDVELPLSSCKRAARIHGALWLGMDGEPA